MPFRRFFGHLLPCLAISTFAAAAAAPGDDAAPDIPSLDEIWNLPVMGHSMPQPDLAATRIARPAGACSIDPLPEIIDAEAIQFEKQEALDTTGLLPEMAAALEKFRKLVTSVGGTFELRSAYRPLAYQEHLQQVWFKWMRELRRNREHRVPGVAPRSTGRVHPSQSDGNADARDRFGPHARHGNRRLRDAAEVGADEEAPCEFGSPGTASRFKAAGCPARSGAL